VRGIKNAASRAYYRHLEEKLQRVVNRTRWDHHSTQEKIAVAKEQAQPAPE